MSGLGAGGTLEAQFATEAPLRAGVWHLVGDGIIVGACDVTYDLFWRDAAGEHAIASWEHHFDPPPAGFDAQPFEGDAVAVAASNARGDALVLRFTVQSAEAIAYIPNGDGAKTNGRIPMLTLPP